MIKRLRVTVDGVAYDVTVEVPDESNAGSPPPVSAPAGTPPPVNPPPLSPAPASAPPSGPPVAKAAGPSGPGDVPSPLSGRVTAVVVQAGQAVKEGDHLVTLEAMKMNTFVFAPKAGKVAAVKTEVGAVVEEGQSLISIE
jgi:biotin carboxyl carrier protein